MQLRKHDNVVTKKIANILQHLSQHIRYIVSNYRSRVWSLR